MFPIGRDDRANAVSGGVLFSYFIVAAGITGSDVARRAKTDRIPAATVHAVLRVLRMEFAYRRGAEQ